MNLAVITFNDGMTAIEPLLNQLSTAATAQFLRMRDKKRVLRAELSQEETSKRRRKARRSTNKAADEKKTAEEGVFNASGSF